MPSKSPAQARLMAAVAHDPAFAKKVGVPVSVGKEFNQADKGTGIRSPKKIKTPVRVRAPHVKVKTPHVHVKAPHVSYKSPAAKVLGLQESPAHPLFRGR